jgi:hypothetical protein
VKSVHEKAEILILIKNPFRGEKFENSGQDTVLTLYQFAVLNL